MNQERIDVLEIYGQVQAGLKQGLLILEAHAENYNDIEDGKPLSIRMIWFPTGKLEKGEPMIDGELNFPKFKNPDFDYKAVSDQLINFFNKLLEEKWPMLAHLSKNPIYREHPDHPEVEHPQPKADNQKKPEPYQ